MGTTRRISGNDIFCLFFVLSSLLFSATLLAQSADELKNPKLIQAEKITSDLEQGQPSKVIVNLTKPTEILAQTKWNSRQSLDILRNEIRSRQEQVLSELTGNKFKLRHLFENQAAFSAQITEDELIILLDNPLVESIEPVIILEPHLAQGIALINASEDRATYNGHRIAIAICDTGIDYGHPMLGGGGFPNSKVIGGYDFGDDDSDPIPNGQAHGTCCAGIAAGDPCNTGDYIGGVAYNAKLYALKISYGSSGSAYSDDMVAAWDWCVTHQNDDPCNPILIISTSFGGDRLFSTCDNYLPSMTTAAEVAVSAGITLLVSSGNDGYCDSISWPACISSVISVGAVYDAAFGNYQPCISEESCATKYFTPTGCSPYSNYYAIDSTSADMVTSYSNTASFLSVLAPSNRAYTTDISGSAGYSSGDYYSSFGGTSAACPYAAGAAACLQTAARAKTGDYLSPAEVKDKLLLNGDNITDAKVNITKPRINLGMAIADLDESPPFANNINISSEPGVQTMITLKGIDDGFPNPPGSLDYIIVSLPQYGDLNDPCSGLITEDDLAYTLTGNGDKVLYTSNICYEVLDSFEYKVNDGGAEPNGGDSNIADVNISVEGAVLVLADVNFTDGIPADWTIVDGFSDGKTWMTDNPSGWTSDYWDGDFAIADSDYAGKKTDMNEQLITGSFDLTEFEEVKLQFSHEFKYFVRGGDEIGDVDIRINGGAWQNLVRYEGEDFGEEKEIDISAWADRQSDVQLQWHYYDATYDWYWGIDNIRITARQILPVLVGDFEPDCDVDLNDYAKLALVWLSDVNDADWDELFDISSPQDGFINEKDLEAMGNNWLKVLP